METALKGTDNVLVYQDDVLVTGNTERKHVDNAKQVRLSWHVMSPILARKIDISRVQTMQDKVIAASEAPVAEHVSQFRSFLGLVIYYASFLPNLPTVLATLNTLLGKDVRWHWTKRPGLNEVKQMLTSAPVPTHYDPKLPIMLTCDATTISQGVRWN